MISFLWGTDPHFKDLNPASRVDDWTETLFDKFRQMADLARAHKCTAVLLGGDIFDISTPSLTSHALVQRMIVEFREMFPCPIYCNVGNHDVKYQQLRFLDQMPLGTMFSSGVFERCYDEFEGSFIDLEDGNVVRIVGIPYHGVRYEHKRFSDIKKKGNEKIICLAHVLASPQGGKMFEGEDIMPYSIFPELCPDVDTFCFLPGTKVTKENGTLISIENLQKTDTLLGRHSPVSIEEVHPERIVDEEVITLDVEGIPSGLISGVTKEHPFWVASEMTCIHPSRLTRRCHPEKEKNSAPCSYCTKPPVLTPSWKPSKDIVPGDFVSIPFPNIEEDKNRESNPGLARLLGYYLAEGHIVLNRKKEPKGGIGWTFHQKEIEYHQDVKDLVKKNFDKDLKFYPCKTSKGIQICSFGKDISEWMNEYGGRYSHLKKLSPKIWTWTKEEKLELLIGWLRGDGHARPNPLNKRRIRSDVMGATVSEDLANQLFLLSLTLGLRPYYTKRPEKEGVQIINCVCDTKEVHVISFYGEDAKMLSSTMNVEVPERCKTKISNFFHEGLYFVRVKSTRKTHYKGPVYNIRTSSQEYVAGTFLTHNCFGHWHKNQGIVTLPSGQQIVNIGSMSRGSLSEDNIDRIPSVALIKVGKEIEIEEIPLKVKPASEVFDLEKRQRQEQREAAVSHFVEKLLNMKEKDSRRISVEDRMSRDEIPSKVKEKAREIWEITGS